jgi:hypothetical protein
MKKGLLTLFVVCVVGVFTAMAQQTGSATDQSTMPAPTQNTGAMNSPSQSGSSTMPPQNQSAMSNGATQSGNGTDLVAEGCLVKEQSSYYIQPETGGARTQLTPSRSLDSYVGQHIQVKGQNDADNNTATATSTGPASATIDESSMLKVTAIKVVSPTCAPSGATTPQH